MIHRSHWALLFALPAVVLLSPDVATAQERALEYEVGIEAVSYNTFNVRLIVDDLGPENAVYQFASTAPGTYQVMDIGRFVSDFRALDSDGQVVATEQVSTNQWQLADPSSVRTIEYSIGETWDTPVDENQVYPMAGTSLEADHLLFNAHAVLGYPTGMQQRPLSIQFDYPDEWLVGTALSRNADGAFLADDYDHAVDSPILLGDLTVAQTEVSGAAIEIYTYSVSKSIDSEQLLGAMSDMLVAEGEFLGELPVDRYVFLYHFENHGPMNGAWEHSFSSEYTLPDIPFSDRAGGFITDIAAHEFLHIITPLNIHSEIIEHFNFVEPVPSKHLWLYEGVTEWSAHTSQMYAGLKSMDEYLDVFVGKINNDANGYDSDYSLEKLALTSFTPEGQQQYGNIYQRGALVAGLLDILLLDLSDGEAGLQQQLQKLMKEYGPDRPFEDCCFYDVMTDMTYPEVSEFFERYVVGAEPLPIRDYYAKLGLLLIEDEDGAADHFEIYEDASEKQTRLREAWQGGR